MASARSSGCAAGLLAALTVGLFLVLGTTGRYGGGDGVPPSAPADVAVSLGGTPPPAAVVEVDSPESNAGVAMAGTGLDPESASNLASAVEDEFARLPPVGSARAPDSSNGTTGSSSELDEAVESAVETLRRRGVFRSHREFIDARSKLIARLHAGRAEAVVAAAAGGDSGVIAFLRLHERESDRIYRVPQIARSAPGLIRADYAPFGLVVSFKHRKWMDGGVSLAAQPLAPSERVDGATTIASAAPSSDSGQPRLPPLRVAIEMSGHMRTYRKCAASLRSNLLASTGGLLFAATYPDLGDKRFGVRVQERDDAVDVSELRQLYGADYFAAAYLVDLPTARERLMRGFPTLFVLKQWSWMIYQLFMMELAHNTTMRHVGRMTETAAYGGQPHLSHSVVVDAEAAASLGASWQDFDVFVRVRPDVYILGQVSFTRLNPVTTTTNEAQVEFGFECGGQRYPPVALNDSDVLRSPHHPRFLWPRDPLSDHSAIGLAPAMNKFLALFSDTVHRPPAVQERRVFYHGQTAERLWGEHAERQLLHVRRVPGWHLMLRNAAKFSNATLHASAFKTKLISVIFGATDPNVGCPAINNCITVLTHKPKPLKGGKKKPSVKPGFTGQDCA